MASADCSVLATAALTPSMLPETASTLWAARSMAPEISSVAAPCSCTAAEMAVAASFSRVTVSFMVSIASATCLVTSLTASMRAPISSVARLVCPASAFTSAATTEKPLPASPARAASMVAFRASRFVWPATSEISRTTSPILSHVTDQALYDARRALHPFRREVCQVVRAGDLPLDLVNGGGHLRGCPGDALCFAARCARRQGDRGRDVARLRGGVGHDGGDLAQAGAGPCHLIDDLHDCPTEIPADGVEQRFSLFFRELRGVDVDERAAGPAGLARGVGCDAAGRAEPPPGAVRHLQAVGDVVDAAGGDGGVEGGERAPGIFRMQAVGPGLHAVGELGFGCEAAQTAELGRPRPPRLRMGGVAVKKHRVPQADAAVGEEHVEQFDLRRRLAADTQEREQGSLPARDGGPGAGLAPHRLAFRCWPADGSSASGGRWSALPRRPRAGPHDTSGDCIGRRGAPKTGGNKTQTGRRG